MKQYLASHMRRYRMQAIGLAFFLAWNYFSFFSCGLVPVIRVTRSSERFWVWTGLFMVIAAIGVLLVSSRKACVTKRPFGVVAALLSTCGTVVVWTAFFNAEAYQAIAAVGGMVMGVGFAMMAQVWGDRMSRYNEAAIEFSAPVSFIVSFFIYFMLLALKRPASMIVDAALPVASMYFAFRGTGAVDDDASGALDVDRRMGGRDLARAVATILTLCLLFAMLWFQFAYFRLLSTPEVVGDRFLHYLVPFTCSFVLSIIVFVSCIKLSRYLNFTLMFRWGLPLLLFSYALLYYSYDDPAQRIVAYTVNFIGMFGVQFSFWMAAPKYVRRSGMPPYVLFGGLLAAEGIGIFLGTGYGLTVIDGVTAANVMHESLLFFAAVLLVAMMVGFNPRWSFFRTGNRWKTRGEEDAGVGDSEGSVVDGIAVLFEHQAEELQRAYGLSNRETEIAALLLAGRSRPYIRDELIISLNTVHSHASNIYTKCGVHSQREFMDLMGSTRHEADVDESDGVDVGAEEAPSRA